MSKTLFSDKCIILHDLYMNHQGDEDWMDFFEIYDLGVPLAVSVNMGGATVTEIGIGWIDETFDAMCEQLGIEDIGFDSIDDMMENAEG